MKRIVWIAAAVLAGSYLLTPGAATLVDGAGFWAWRREIVLLTGLIGLLAMTGAVLLATRPAWLERPLGGLDKAYALHKWLGIAAGVSLGLHWFAENGGRWLVELGWVMRRVRAGGHGGGADGLHAFARETGEWAFYILITLVLVALIKKIPYRYFRWVHKALAAVFLVGAFHAVVLMPLAWFSTPLGWLVVASAVIGSAAAVWALSGRIGAARTQRGNIGSISVTPAGLIDLRLALAEPGLRSKAGQFAFLRFDASEGAHPFTIASADDPCRPRFIIKPLGDYTASLAATLKPGQAVQLEGPYGCFDFSADGEREIWIAGGIGVTPFLARLDALIAQGGSRRPVDFWYCTEQARQAVFPDDLAARCERAGVILHRMAADCDGLLSAEAVVKKVGGLGRSQVWFCGPRGFALSLGSGMRKLGLREEAFHAERFAMR